jgi:hypothetical protein
MLAKMDSFQEETKTNQAKTDANQEMLAEMKISQAEMLAKMEAKIGSTQENMIVNETDANQREMKAEIRANNEKFEVL